MSKLQKLLQQSFRTHSDRPFVTLKKDFAYQRFSFSEIFDLSLKFSSLLKDKKIKKGDRIAVCIYNSPQYAITFVASLFSGVVLVPLDFGASSKFINQIMKETDCKLLVTSQYKVVRTGVDKLFIEDFYKILEPYPFSKIDYDVEEDDLVQILYTSGTTGKPKGVMLSHENLFVNLTSVAEVIQLSEKDISLSVLPLSHVFEQVCGFLFFLINGASIIYMKSRRGSEIVKLFKKEKISILLTVPALMMIFKGKIEEKARNAGKIKTLHKMMTYADRLPRQARRVLFSKVHKTFGGKLTRVVVGGAHLPEDVELFWERLGFKVVKGYGLTETSPILTATPEDDRLIGSVGPVIPNVELKFSDDKEIWARGKSVFQGYYKMIKETKSVFEDGWFKTGDIGELDERGFLFLRGRVKNMILTASGLNVYPEDIEKHLNSLGFVKESVVVGVTKKEKTLITAVLLLTDSFIEKKQKGMKANLKKQIDKVNSHLEPHQRIQDFVVWEGDLPRTLTLKVKRADVEKALSSDHHGEDQHDDQLLNILSSLSHVNAEKIADRMFLFADLGFDSLRILELATMIEEKLKVEIEESKINAQTTVRVLREFIEHAKKQQSSNKDLPPTMFWWIFQPIRLFLIWAGFSVIKLFISSFRVEGYPNVRDLKEPVIVVSNHTSHFDILTVMNHFPSHMRAKVGSGGAADYFFKTEKLSQRILSWVMFHLLGSFPIARNDKVKHFTLKQSMEYAGEVADKGWSILIFPEGTRTSSGQINEFKTGTGLIVKETEMPVLPVKIEGYYDIFPKGALLPKGRGPVTIKYGEVVRFDNKLSAEEITQRLEKIIRRM